jgi:hypothetical protein
MRKTASEAKQSYEKLLIKTAKELVNVNRRYSRLNNKIQLITTVSSGFKEISAKDTIDVTWRVRSLLGNISNKVHEITGGGGKTYEAIQSIINDTAHME